MAPAINYQSCLKKQLNWRVEMKYLYYPGCSLEGTSIEYDIATRSFMEWTGSSLEKIDDWTCCGASAAESKSMLLSYVLPARNLALAEAMDVCDQIMVPCSACYLNLKKTEQAIKNDKTLLETINQALTVDNLVLNGNIRVRHLLDVLVNDLDFDRLVTGTKNRMSGIKAAPYYGCQCLRPFSVFDDPEAPHSMDRLIQATGGTVFNWDMGAQCCGASHTSTEPEAGLILIEKILASAKGADLILTVCPMCQMNLEGYQKQICRKTGENLEIPVLFLPQFLGLALGKPPKSLGLNLNLSNLGPFFEKLGGNTDAGTRETV